MIRLTKSGWMAMTLLGLFVGAAQADDGAVVRISDSPPPAPAAASGAPTPSADAGPAPAVGIEGVPCDSGSGIVEGDVGRARLCGCLRALLAYDPARLPPAGRSPHRSRCGDLLPLLAAAVLRTTGLPSGSVVPHGLHAD